MSVFSNTPVRALDNDTGRFRVLRIRTHLLFRRLRPMVGFLRALRALVKLGLDRSLVGAAAASALSVPLVVEAQAATDRVVARDSSARMERVADGVYAIIHDAATDGWPHGNTGVVVGSDGVLVIDSNYLPIRAARDIALIRKVTPLPVRYLVNTHWHGDHTHGNGVYRDSFPSIAIVGPKASAYFVEMNQEKLPKGALLPNSANRTTLANLEARVN